MTKDETPEIDATDDAEQEAVADVEIKSNEGIKSMDDAEVLMYVEEATPKPEEGEGGKKKGPATKLPTASAPDQEAVYDIILKLEELTFDALNARLGGPLVARLIELADKGLLTRTFKGGRYRYTLTAKGHKLVQNELG